MLVAESRPRNLKWYHSGALLFGDWGTSRLYVLGLTFFFTAHASAYYLAAIGVLMLAVAWAYVVVCRSFPEGGGVYSAARQLNPTLAVVGATLLLCGYIMTAAISVVEAFHYFGLPRELTLAVSFLTIIFIGIINWFGAHAAGRAALLVAVAAGVASLALALACIPLIPAGFRNISWDIRPPSDAWVVFTRLCLAMAGIEAVANMTGVMRQPVLRTARRTIWPVAIEVVFFNLFFALALMGLMAAAGGDHSIPDAVRFADVPADQIALTTLPDGRSGEEVLHHRDVAMKVLAIHSGQHWLGQAAGFYAGKIAAIVFGVLLLSAANTAIMAMVSVLYAMGQDRELPKALTKLNYSGVPWAGLLLSLALPIVVLLITQDPQILAELYVIGVIGAVTTNILSCAFNGALPMRAAERAGMWALGIFLFLIAVTIVITKPNATIFAGSVVAIILLTRWSLKVARPRVLETLPEPAVGWLAEVQRQTPPLDPAKPRIMLAARGRYQSEFAVDLARRRSAALFAIYVRTLRLIDVAPGKLPRIEDDPDAQKALGTTAVLAREAGVPFFPIYVTSTDIAAEILDYTVTYGCDTLIMGKSLRTPLARRLTGDVVAHVAQLLPDNVALLTRSPEVPHIPGTHEGVTFHPRTDAEEQDRRDGADAPPPT